MAVLPPGGLSAPIEFLTDNAGVSGVGWSMPRLPTEPLQGVAFLYKTADEARANAREGGTCFLVSKTAPQASKLLGKRAYVPFWISNRHVVMNAAAPVVRLNKRDGGTKIIDYDCLDWVVHPNGDDLAGTCALGHIDAAEDEIKSAPDWYLITKEKAFEYQIGIGDEVAMFGRFINHQGRETIKPAARLGSISMMPEPIWNGATQNDQLSYAVEMRSRTGFSGSPVAMYRTPATTLVMLPEEIQYVHGILGVSWGHILDEDGENTWLNGVIPAWKILELLEAPDLKAKFDESEAAILKSKDGSGAVPSVAAGTSEAPTTDENPQHKEDFTRLLGAATQGKPTGDQT